MLHRRRPTFHASEAAAPSEAAWLRAHVAASFENERAPELASLHAEVTAAAAAAGVDIVRGVRALGYRSLSDCLADEIDERQPE